MGLMTKAVKDAEEALAKARADMAKRNAEHMERTASYRPTPTPDEMRRVMLGDVVETQSAAPAPQPVEPPVEPPAAEQQEKSSDPKAASDRGTYNTRGSTAKK